MTDMYKLIDWGTNIVQKFFNRGVSVDRQIAPDLLRGAKGIILLREVKAGFVWTGKLGGGIILARLPDGSWSPPSAIGLGGMGWGAEIGGELTDFMIILGSDSAVKSFKRSGQVSFGAGMDLAIGPFGRVAQANATASVGGVGVNYTYSMSKGAYAGIGLRGDVIICQGKTNQKFYGRTDDLKPAMILEGHAVPPPGACDFLWDSLRKAETGEAYGEPYVATVSYDTHPQSSASRSGGSSLLPASSIPQLQQKIEQMEQMGVKHGWCEYALRRCNGNVEEAVNFCFDNSSRMDSLVATQAAPSPQSSRSLSAIPGIASGGLPIDESDPRLRRFKSEAEVWAIYNGSQASASSSSAAETSIPVASAVPVPPSKATAVAMPPTTPMVTATAFAIPPLPPAASGAEQKEVYMKVMAFCKGWFPDDGGIQMFKANCKSVGQGAMTIEEFHGYLVQVFSRDALLTLIPDLVRLMPTEDMRHALWSKVFMG